MRTTQTHMQQTCKMVSDATVLPPILLLSLFFFFKLGGASRVGPERSKCLATLRVLHQRAVKKVSHFKQEQIQSCWHTGASLPGRHLPAII